MNIKIPLNREMRENRLSFEARNKLLAKMTDEVSEIVLEDNRLQSLALSIAEAGGAQAVPAHAERRLAPHPGKRDEHGIVGGRRRCGAVLRV